MPEAERAPLERALGRILLALRPYLHEVIVIGGWVPYLYQRYGPFPGWRGRLSLTAELDVMLTHELPPMNRRPLAEILRAADFRPVNDRDPAAVWANDPERGEKIEFLVPHRQTARTQNDVVPIVSQPGIAAVSLRTLDVMQRHARTLTVGATGPAGEQVLLDVRIPTLGAYTVNKAATYNYRTPLAAGGANPKLAKDLLYLRDLMSAGDEVVSTIQRDIQAMLEADAPTRKVVDTAGNNLVGTTRVGRQKLGEAGAMLAERDGIGVDAATADVTGHLTDLAELLTAFRS